MTQPKKAAIGGVFVALLALVVFVVQRDERHETSVMYSSTRTKRTLSGAQPGSPPQEIEAQLAFRSELPAEVVATADLPASEPASSNQADPRIDLAGVAAEHRLRLLLNAHEEMLKLQDPTVPESTKARAELGFVQRCVGAILLASGRAHFPDDVDLRRGGFSIRAVNEIQQAFTQDGALYRFNRGEFPTYDAAYDRVFVPDDREPIPRPHDFDEQIEVMLCQALDSIGVPKTGER